MPRNFCSELNRFFQSMAVMPPIMSKDTVYRRRVLGTPAPDGCCFQLSEKLQLVGTDTKNTMTAAQYQPLIVEKITSLRFYSYMIWVLVVSDSFRC